MQYKTIMLELLQEYPTLHQELRAARQLLPALGRYATDLKTRHLYWIEALRQQQPQSAPEQIASAALEIAVQELRDSLPHDSPPNVLTSEPFSLAAAMAVLRRHTPPA